MTSQHRTTFYLLLNNGLAAGTGLLFWFILVRLARLPPQQIGVGYAIIALGTTVSLVAKGGLDTALLRTVPHANPHDGRRLFGVGLLVGAGAAGILAAALALLAHLGVPLPGLAHWSWLLVAGIAVLTVGISMQDAWFLAHGDPQATFRRNLVFSSARIALPLPILALAPPEPVPVVWLAALVAAALTGIALARHRRHPALPLAQRPVAPRTYLRCAARNVTGSAAEFLPGLLLAPLVLATQGPAAAAYFGMAWTAAALLLLGAAAIGRSALATMARDGDPALAVRHATHHALLVLAPAATIGVLLAGPLMGLFGTDYATRSAPAFAVLCASTLFVSPAFLYLAYLRAQDRPAALVVFPLAMIATLFVLAPLLATRHGLVGVSLAWLLANAPFGAWAAWRLHRIAQEVTPHAATALHRDPDPQ